MMYYYVCTYYTLHKNVHTNGQNMLYVRTVPYDIN